MPGLSSDPSGKGAGLCGRHAATKIMRRITRAPKAIPSIAALEIVAASNKKRYYLKMISCLEGNICL